MVLSEKIQLPSRLGLLALLGSGALLLGAYYFQYVVGLAPCEMCYWQRYPHMVAIVAGLAALATFSWPRIALVCTVCSVLGGLLGYAIGYYFFETMGAWLVRTYGLQSGLESFRAGFAEYGIWIILIKGLTPIPYKLVTIASGAAHFDLFTFLWASIVTRGARFFIVAALLWKFGEPIRAFIEQRLTLVTWLFLIALVGGFVAFRYLF